MNREPIIRDISEKFREMSTETIMFHQSVADVLGLHITDHKCLDLIYRFGAMPAGRLAELTGLTTGAVTGIIDRLEEAGYVRRTNDPEDRRRTIVEPTRNKKLEKRLEAIFIPLRDRMHNLLSLYSDSELVFLLNATTEMIKQTREESRRLRILKNKDSFG
jgi:DNA-binding MarR family transcriptional regulator